MKQSESIDGRFEEWFDEKDDFNDASDIPSWELLAQAGDLFKGILKRHDSGRDLSPDFIQSVIAAALMLSESADHKKFAVKTFALALAELEDLTAEYPEIAQRLLGVTSTLLIGSQFIITGNALARHKNVAKRLDPLVKVNAPKAAAMEHAQAIATALWEADADREFNISAMAEQVKDIMIREGFEDLPKIERIKLWIKPAAPDYASKPGRPRKTP